MYHWPQDQFDVFYKKPVHTSVASTSTEYDVCSPSMGASADDLTSSRESASAAEARRTFRHAQSERAFVIQGWHHGLLMRATD